MNKRYAIFDMDGTLWDAVDSYSEVWNETFRELSLKAEPVTRDRLMRTMGLPLDKILAIIAPDLADKDRFLKVLDKNEDAMMPRLGGRLFPGVRETLAALAKKMPLFMVSNCGAHGLDNFLDYTGLRPYFRDVLAHGMNGLSKGDNIRLIAERHNLQAPAYVGDTESDAIACRHARVPFIWAAYGFGKVTVADAVIHKFSDLLDLVSNNSAPHVVIQ